MAWTISQPSWPVTSVVNKPTISQLNGASIVTRDGATEGNVRLKNGLNTNPIATSEIITQVNTKGNIYTGQVAKSIQTASRFPMVSGTNLHTQLNSTLIASNSDSTCCAEDRYAPISVALSITVPNAPIVTNAMIVQILTSLLGQFVDDEGALDFLSVMQGSARANID